MTAIINAELVMHDHLIPDAVLFMEDGKISGDVDFESVSQVAGWITPVPGGVGPMTVAMLMRNAVIAAENKI